MKIVIVGGVAGGASAAARARRLNEDAEIIMFERGEFISFANCGLPYHVSNVIPERSSLLVMTPPKFKAQTNIDVRILHEVTKINRDKKTVAVRNLHTGESLEESYDKLILATGSSPVRPPIPGADDPDVMTLWTIPDMDRIRGRLDDGAKNAVVIGGGFIGLEVAENLRERGVDVSVVEMLPQVLPPLDPEMAVSVKQEFENHDVDVRLSQKVTEIRRPENDTQVSPQLEIDLEGGKQLVTDLVILSIGVRPNNELATDAGLDLGQRGGIQTNDRMQTSDPNIYAVGDVDEVTDIIRDCPTQIPLAGPANRQARIAADNILGRDSRYRGTLGTSVVKIFDLTAANTGANEKTLQKDDIEYRKIYIHPANHAGYYPGATPISLKLLFAPEGRVLGAQAVGRNGVDKRIDVISTAILAGQTIYDLENLELAYAPPYGSAKDPVNFAGMVAGNALRGDSTLIHADSIPEDALLLDVREEDEYAEGHLDEAVLIPVGQLRDRLDELPRDRHIAVYCKVGLRGYLAERILKQEGYDASNLSGGYITYCMYRDAGMLS
ncbi:MAG: FAD-dependent oxidoreductase [Lentisphaeria bacterium]